MRHGRWTGNRSKAFPSPSAQSWRKAIRFGNCVSHILILGHFAPLEIYLKNEINKINKIDGLPRRPRPPVERVNLMEKIGYSKLKICKWTAHWRSHTSQFHILNWNDFLLSFLCLYIYEYANDIVNGFVSNAKLSAKQQRAPHSHTHYYEAIQITTVRRL